MVQKSTVQEIKHRYRRIESIELNRANATWFFWSETHPKRKTHANEKRVVYQMSLFNTAPAKIVREIMKRHGFEEIASYRSLTFRKWEPVIHPRKERRI